MERLTIPDEKIDGGMKRTCVDSREVKKYAMTLYWALKNMKIPDLHQSRCRK